MEPKVIKIEECNVAFYSGEENCCPRYMRFWDNGDIDFVAFDEKGNAFDPRKGTTPITGFELSGRHGKGFKKGKNL